MRWKYLLLIVFLSPGVGLAETLAGRVVGITDGDTLTLLVDRTQHKIRLAEIDTPERGQDWGRRASQVLSDKVSGKDVRVEVSGTDRYDRRSSIDHTGSLDRIWRFGFHAHTTSNIDISSAPIRARQLW